MSSHIPKTPVPVQTFLKADASIIGGYIQHIEFLRYLQQKLIPFLAPPLNQHCTIANYANDTLVLHTEAPAWASRLRYNTPGILDFLHNECGLDTLRTIRIKVKPTPSHPASLSVKSWKPDKTTAALIRRSAATISDEPLRHVLEKISGHYQNGD